MCIPLGRDKYTGTSLNPTKPDDEPEDRWKSYREEYGHAPYFTYANDKYNQTKLDMKLIQEEVDDEFMDWDEACQWYLEQEYNERQDHEIN